MRIVYSRGGQLAARGPHVARHIVFSGPREHSEKILKSAISSSLVLGLTCQRLVFISIRRTALRWKPAFQKWPLSQI